MKLTTRQKDVMDNLSNVKTDGSRVQPQFRLGDRNVTAQVRSLMLQGIVELQGASLIAVEPAVKAGRAAVDTAAAVDAMRSFLGGGEALTRGRLRSR